VNSRTSVLVRATRTLVLLAASALAACGDTTGADDAREITLGGAFSLTGNWSSLGVASKAAMELAVEDVNAFAAGRNITFRADVRDTRLEPARALQEMESLRGSGVRLVIGPQSSAELAAVKPFVDANGLIVVSQSSTAGSLAVADRIFRLTPADSLEGVAMAALMYADGIRAVVPAWRADAGNQGLEAGTRRAFTARGGTASAGVEYATSATSYAATVTAIGAQVRQALATRPAAQVAVQLSAFDEAADILALAAADPVLASVRWYGADGVTQSTVILGRAGAAAFARTVGFPAPTVGADPAARSKWEPLAARIQARAGGAVADAFAFGVYDAVWIAAQAYLASPADVQADSLAARFQVAAGTHYGATGWTVLNAAGDRREGIFDFWAIRTAGAGRAWTQVASYDTRLGTLTRR
jgi:branched-chain amino acid transport system substrate-binding protein